MAEDLGAHFEVVDFYFVHLAHIHIAADGIQRVRVVRLAEKSGGAAFADHVAFLQRTRQHHKGEHRLILRLEAGDVGAEVWEIFWTGRLQLAGGAHFVGRVTGHHLVNGRRMIEESVGRVAHRTHHREFVVHLGEVRQQLGKIDAGNFRLDRRKHALHIGGRVGFGIPQIEMARATL